MPPDESDCCNSGCNPCILDVYEAQLKKYNEFLQKNCDFRVEKINCVSLTSYTIFTLIERQKIGQNVFLYTFLFEDSTEKQPNCFEYNPGQYLLLRAKDSEGEFTRAYTPIPMNKSEDYLGFSVLIRLYNKGRMSKLLKKLEIGHKTSWRGPYGDFTVSYTKFLFFVAQGTGIAPVYSVIHELVHNGDCESFIKLFFCCRSCDDILLRQELCELGAFWNFSYEIFLSNSDGLTVKYNEAVHETKLSFSELENYLKGKLGQTQVIICGSETFSEQIKQEIQKIGIESSHIYLF